MAEIVGTITNLSDFLSKTQVCLSVKPNDPQQQIICLEADRKYSIPAFQREVRWDDNNLKMLLYDLSRSSKFLGNIILTIKSDHTCEIIDGQQRTTVLMLIVSCIKKKFGTKISTPDLCPLRNEGFTGFQTLLEKAFDQEAITSDDWNGDGYYGIYDAAKGYFGKQPSELSDYEAIMLAGLPNAPSAYSPSTNPELAHSRMKIVLSKMVECDVITQEEAEVILTDGK